jgi:two-component system NtrC family response regulator
MSSVLSVRAREPIAPPPIIGSSSRIQSVRHRIQRFATSSLPVLLVGPTGTGKEVIAQHLHASSGRVGEMIEVNCGALPRDMIESLLFGHRKGAFTGATESTDGFIARAHRGTLFLDELSSLPLEGQAKLLRLLETGEFFRLGETDKRRLEFRVVAAAQEDLEARMEAGLFRRDLFHRVAGLRIDVPALAVRREDIWPLAEHFAGGHGCVLSAEVGPILLNYSWPGNVRELRLTIERAAILSDTTLLDGSVIMEAFGGVLVNAPLGFGAIEAGDSVAKLRGELLRVCASHGARSPAIAAALGISRATLFRRLRALGISLEAVRVSRSLTSL